LRLTGDALNRHYADSYARDPRSAWRELGAREKARSVLRLVDPPVGSVVDVGCGEGSLFAALDGSLPASSYVGYDVSPAAIETARAREHQTPVTFEVFAGERIPREDGAFDLAILSHVLEHVAEPRMLLTETARVARRVVLEVPLELHLRSRRFEWDDTGHINVFNRRSIRYLVESCGLDIQRERIYCPEREAHAFRGGRRGELKWLLKRTALRLGGQAVFTYHYAALVYPAADE
jgi:SAM-dependent methyltransferase